MKTKVKSGACFITTDEQIFTGANMKERAEKHQKHLMMKELSEEITKKAREILNVPDYVSDKGGDVYKEDVSDEEESFMEYIKKNVDAEMEYFDEFVGYFVGLVLVDPTGIEKLAGVISYMFEQLEV